MPELVGKRTRSSKTYFLGGRKFAYDGTIGSIHYEDNGWQEIDNEFLPVSPPWDWEMLRAGYHIRVKEDFTAGQIIEFEVELDGILYHLQFQPHALEWTNDLDQIQQISMPQNVTPVITNPIVDLLPAVGVPSHQGTIRWDDAYGQGIDFQWRCASTRLMKTLEIENFNNLPTPEQYIINGGNPVLRLNLIFDPPSKQDVDIVVDGQVWNQQSDAQTFSIIEFVKDGEVLWGFMPLKYWDSGDNGGQSIATLEKRGNKLHISIRVPYNWLQSAIYPVFIDTDVDEEVTDWEDDSVEDAQGNQDRGANYIVLGTYGNNDRYSGMRFRSVIIASVVEIITAHLSWRAAAGDSEAFECDLYGQDKESPIKFSYGNRDITNRTLTSAVVQCDSTDLGNWTNTQDYDSPEIKTIIQELVDTYDYSSGLPLVILSRWQSGLGQRLPLAYDWNGLNTTKIHIEFEEGGEPEPVVVTPTTLALILTTYAPTVTVSDNQEVTPGTLALSITEYAPSVIIGIVSTPSTLALTITTYIPTIAISDNQVVTPSTLALALTLYAPTIEISDNIAVTPTTLVLTLATFIPSISITGNLIVTPTTLVLSLTGYAPDTLTPRLVTPGTKALILNTFASIVSTPRLVTPSTLVLSLTSYASSIVIGTIVTPPTLALVLTKYIPTVLTPRLATPPTTALVITSYIPSIVIGIVTTPSTIALTLTSYEPTILTPRLVTPSTVALIITSYVPTISAAVLVTPTTLVLSLTTYMPTVLAPRLVTPSTLALILTMYIPTVSAPRLVTPLTLALSLTFYAPTILTPRLVTPSILALILTNYIPTPELRRARPTGRQEGDRIGVIPTGVLRTISIKRIKSGKV